MKRIGQLCAMVFMVALLTFPGSALGYSAGRLIDNVVMNNVVSMSEPQIEELLSHSPCLVSYTETGFHWDGEHWHYESVWAAAKIINEAAHQWGLNPQVIIAKLQQEEGLLSTSACESWKYSSAMGYDCPDSGECSSKYAGFTKQVLWGAYQLKFNEERSEGRTGWDEDGSLVYAGFMLKGVFARCEACELTAFSGVALIDGTEVYLETGAAASLYSYTPHLAGGRLFEEIFEEYFGSTIKEESKHEEPEKQKEEPKSPPPVQTIQQVVTTPSSGVTGTPPVSQPATTKCFVPKLRGKTLAQAEKLLIRSHCKVGKVSRPKGHGKHRLTVRSQSPAASKQLPVNSKVALRLG